MLLQRLEEIKQGLKHTCYFGALALALTLPDICGKAEFPESSVRERYTKWYDKQFGDYLRNIPFVEESTNRPYISGELLYQLRCSFLHSGNAIIENEARIEMQNKSIIFELEITEHYNDFTPFTEIYTYDDITEKQHLIVNVEGLCRVLISIAQSYYEENKDKFSFFQYNIIYNRKPKRKN